MQSHTLELARFPLAALLALLHSSTIPGAAPDRCASAVLKTQAVLLVWQAVKMWTRPADRAASSGPYGQALEKLRFPTACPHSPLSRPHPHRFNSNHWSKRQLHRHRSSYSWCAGVHLLLSPFSDAWRSVANGLVHPVWVAHLDCPSTLLVRFRHAVLCQRRHVVLYRLIFSASSCRALGTALGSADARVFSVTERVATGLTP